MNKKTKLIWLGSAFAATVTTIAPAIALASCSNPTHSGEIPSDCFIIDANGVITGLKDGDYNGYETLKTPANATSIAADAFRGVFTDDGNGISTHTVKTIILTSNIKKIGANAFRDCTSIEKIDLSTYDADGLISLLQDENCGANSFMNLGKDGKGDITIPENLPIDSRNKIELCFIAAGLDVEWFEIKPVWQAMEIQGNTQLAAKEYEGDDSSKTQATWTAHVTEWTPSDVSKHCEWHIHPISEDFPAEKITVNKYLVDDDSYAYLKWDEDLKAGEYKFKVWAEYTLPKNNNSNEKPELGVGVSEEITLKITANEFNIDAGNSIESDSMLKGSKSDLITDVKFNGNSIKNDVYWTMAKTDSDKITITNDGIIHWEELPAKTYNFTIQANYKFKGKYALKATKDVSLTLSDKNVVVSITETAFSIDELKAGNTTESFSVAVQDYTINKIYWSITPISPISFPKDCIYINDNNQIAWKDTITCGPDNQYKFVANANVDGKWTGSSQPITLTVKQSNVLINGGSTTLQGPDYLAGSDSEPYSVAFESGAKVKPDDGLVNWYIESSVGNNIYMDPDTPATNAILKWDNLAKGDYSFTIHAEWTQGGISRHAKTSSKTLSISERQFDIVSTLKAPTHVDEYEEGKFEGKAEVKNLYPGETVEWSIKEKLSGFYATKQGIFGWNDTLAAGTYQITPVATIKVNGTSKQWVRELSPVKVTISQVPPIVNAPTSLSAYRHIAGESTDPVVVTWKGGVVTPDKLEIIPVSTQTDLTKRISINKDNKIAWDEYLKTGENYKFKVKATYRDRTNESDSITLSAQSLQAQWTTKGSESIEYAIGDEPIDTKPWSVSISDPYWQVPLENVDFTIKSSVSGDEGKISIDKATGLLKWDKDIAEGEHKISISAVAYGDIPVNEVGYTTINVTNARNLTNNDLLIDSNQMVVGLKTDISKWAKDISISLNIDIDGTKVKGISQIKGTSAAKDYVIENQEIIKELNITVSATDDQNVKLQTKDMFHGLKSFETITIKGNGNNMVDVGTTDGNGYIFNEGGLVNVKTINLEYVNIGKNAFKGQTIYSQFKNVTNLNMNYIGNVGKSAFESIGDDENIDLSIDNLIGEWEDRVFYGSAIKFEDELKLNYGVPAFTFYSCKNFAPSKVTIKGSVGENAFGQSGVKTVVFNNDEDGYSIGSSAFYGADSLETVTFASDTQFDSIGYNIFGGCDALTTIDVSAVKSNRSLAKDTSSSAFGSINQKGIIYVYSDETKSDWTTYFTALTSGRGANSWTVEVKA